MTKDVAEFYDQFAKQQIRTGVNSRHLSIISKLKIAGLKTHHKVLEVGCGIGTVSQLIAKNIPAGEVTAVDISPKSIAQAKAIWKGLDNLHFEVSDMKNFQKKDTLFDVIVFPDVLEHIPVEDHFTLFETVNKYSHSTTFIFIHIPSPRFLEWMILNEPEKLQVIDQPLDTGELVSKLSANDFYLDKMETYSLFYQEKDYQYFVFKKKQAIEKTNHRNKWSVLGERLWIKLKQRIPAF
jgi:SAM-dependent methyltransferase